MSYSWMLSLKARTMLQPAYLELEDVDSGALPQNKLNTRAVEQA